MNWQHFIDLLRGEMASGIVGSSLARLVLAAILGGVIGLERELNHRPAGLRTNMFICFGAALFTVLSARWPACRRMRRGSRRRSFPESALSARDRFCILAD